MMLKLLLIDIDGLRADVFEDALCKGAIPNIAKLLGSGPASPGIVIPVLATAPSITFASQASLFTGSHPSQHGIPGNQFFDRFGIHNEGRPRHYAFDVGDTLAGDDAVMVFTHELASDCLMVPTIYERFADLGWRMVVAGNMYAKGADFWIKPSLIHLARFTKGGNLFGMESKEFDHRVLRSTMDFISQDGLPEVLTLYLMGLDHESHHHGPQTQFAILTENIDPMMGEFWEAVCSLDKNASPLVALFSDHGQISVIPDDTHSLRLAFPFEREIGHLFDALNLDVHDYPGEDPACDAVVCSNGGLAYVYLQNKKRSWADIPDFERDVRSVAKAFWRANRTGEYASELKGSLSGILIRDVHAQGWYAPYLAYTEDDRIISLESWFSSIRSCNHGIQYKDPVHRLNNLCSPLVGDLLLISNYKDGYYFGPPVQGVHGGLHPDDSFAALALGSPELDQAGSKRLQEAVWRAVNQRCQAEGGRSPSTADVLTALLSALEILDWGES